MPYTVKLPPTMRSRQLTRENVGGSPLSKEPDTTVTTGFVQPQTALHPTQRPCHDGAGGSVGLRQEPLGRLLDMSLDRFEQEGQLLEVQVAWWPETLFFVPSVRDVEGLRSEGIERYRVWTAHELATLLQRPGLDSEGVRLAMVVRG